MTAEWVFALATACQRFICLSYDAPLADVHGIAAATLRSIPPPESPAAAAVLRSTLVELAVRFGFERHGRLIGACVSSPCAALHLSDVGRLWRVPDQSLIARFENWIGEYCDRLARDHRTPLAQRVAQLIEDQPDSPLSVTTLAKAVGAHPSSIRRSFRRQLHSSPREYQTRTRVKRAEELLRTSDAKVETVALAVGWQSKKNLYRAFRQVRGYTPGSVRRRVD